MESKDLYFSSFLVNIENFLQLSSNLEEKTPEQRIKILSQCIFYERTLRDYPKSDIVDHNISAKLDEKFSEILKVKNILISSNILTLQEMTSLEARVADLALAPMAELESQFQRMSINREKEFYENFSSSVSSRSLAGKVLQFTAYENFIRIVREVESKLQKDGDLKCHVSYSLIKHRFTYLLSSERQTHPEDEKRRNNFYQQKIFKQIEILHKNYTIEVFDKFKKSEGYTIWLRDRQSLSTTISGERLDSSDTEMDKSSQNWLAADAYIHSLVINKEKLTVDQIRKVHEILAEGLENNGGTPGELRTTDINCGDKHYLPGAMVEESIEEFMDWFDQETQKINADPENKKNVLVFAAGAYQRFVSIHPFSDGNGRVSRFIMDYILEKFNFPPPLISKENTCVAIFTGLSDDDSTNVHPSACIKYVFEGVHESLKMILS